ncbi:MAG: dihydroxyacetone kinase subunit L [Chitinophagaceae bacterium]|nr:dihydroxyacetone kinase subunit L [Anaerolineae bacterium]
MINRDAIIDWLEAIAHTYDENQQVLTDLDSPIGDADHGANMARGFNKVAQKIPSYAERSIGEILNDVGLTLMSTIGGSSGPLYGVFFLNASKIAFGKDTLSAHLITTMFESGLMGIVKLGKASPEDKTMVDALSPAVEALKAAVAENKTLSDSLLCAVTAAEAGMKATIPMQARKGRASYLGERSIGHQDPGATSITLLIKAAYNSWHETN